MKKRNYWNLLKYHLWKDTRSLIPFYLMILLAYVLFIVLNVSLPGEERRIIGLEAASLIYLFVCGMHAYRERLYLFLQHGFSRGTLMGSFFISALVFSLILSLIDSGLWVLNSQWTRVDSLFQQVYAARAFGVHPEVWLIYLCWSWMAYLTVYLLGFMLASINFRMVRNSRIVISIAIPAIMLLGILMIDRLTGGVFSSALKTAFLWCIYGAGNRFCPWCGVRSFAGFSALFMLITWLVSMRAPVRRSF